MKLPVAMREIRTGEMKLSDLVICNDLMVTYRWKGQCYVVFSVYCSGVDVYRTCFYVTCEVTGKVSDVLYVVSTRVHVSVGKLILKLY